MTGPPDDLALALEQRTRELHASEARFRSVIERNADAIVLVDRHGVVCFANPAAAALFGRPVDDLVGSHFGFPVVAGETTEIDVVGQAQRTIAAEMRVVDTEWEGHPAFLATLRDITDRKEAEVRRVELIRAQAAQQEAEAVRQRLQFLADASAVLASSLDVETTLQRVVELAVPTLADWCTVNLVDTEQQAPGSLTGLTVAHVDPAKVELVREIQRRYTPRADGSRPIADVLRTQQVVLLPEVNEAMLREMSEDAEHAALRRALGYSSVIAAPMRARGRLLGTVAFVSGEGGRRYGPADAALAEDLAHRAAMALDNALLYHQAQEAIRTRDDFLSVAAHELKTPITSLSGYSQLLTRQIGRSQSLDPARVQRALETMDRSATRLFRLIAQMLELSRIQSGSLVLERQPLDLAQLLGDVVEITQARTQRHRLVLHALSPLRVVADSARLEQVLLNLLENAIKFSPDGGDILVSARRLPGERLVHIEVRDHGIGIAREEQARLFERFYQARVGHHFAGMAGLGLGLYVSREIVERHGGQITIESPSDGGTRVVVHLPATETEIPPARPANTTPIG